MSEFETPAPAADAPVFHAPAAPAETVEEAATPATDLILDGSPTSQMRSDIVAGHVNRVIAEKTAAAAGETPVFERSPLAANLAEPFTEDQFANVQPGHEDLHIHARNSAQASADALFEKGVREAAVANAVRTQFDAAVNAQADAEIAELMKARVAEATPPALVATEPFNDGSTPDHPRADGTFGTVYPEPYAGPVTQTEPVAANTPVFHAPEPTA
jgi:hypothetical protein